MALPCRQFADAPRGGLQLAFRSIAPSAVGGPNHKLQISFTSPMIFFASASASSGDLASV